MTSKTGRLFVVATPIGNRDDITRRALDVLQQVSLVAAEDTRHSGALLAYYGIAARTISVHEHNESRRVATVLAALGRGDDVALVSDAGTPLVSDPGFDLVNAVRQAGFAVVPVPGASALLAALSVAGLPTDRFVFEGFLPARPMARQRRLATLVDESRTIVFFEAPHRLLGSLAAMAGVFGLDRQAVVARELTKRFETVLRGSLADLIDQIEADSNQQRGEFVVMVHGVPARDVAASDGERVLAILLDVLPVSQAAELAARISGDKKNRLYRLALSHAGDTAGAGDSD